MAKYGLLGRQIDYSFSREFFNKKFIQEQRSDIYVNLDYSCIEDFMGWFKTQNTLCGFNVTIPYKEAIIPFLDEIDPVAEAIGAVNTVVIKSHKSNKPRLIGYNTDHLGFRQSLEHWAPQDHKKALILGTGGAAKAILYVLGKLDYDILQLSRNSGPQTLGYDELTRAHLTRYRVIVNCTPLGTFPDIEQAPKLPYTALGPEHYLYDLIYNPEETEFLKRGRDAGAQTKNGRQMLEYQAIEAWKLWQKIV